MPKSGNHSTRGAALVMVIIVTLILLSIGTTMLVVGSGDLHTSRTISEVDDTRVVSPSTLDPPRADPPPGTYDRRLDVALTSTSPGASIYYTSNGEDPTPQSQLYVQPITVVSSTTIKAIAVKDGITSTIAVFDYVILRPAAPQASPPPGYYAQPQTVTLSTTTPGAVIHYTLNGEDPTTDSPVYVGPITIGTSTTIKAIAVKNGLQSDIAQFSYDIGTGFAFIDRDYDNRYDPGEEIVPRQRLESGQVLATPYRLVIPQGVGTISPSWFTQVDYRAANGIVIGKGVEINTWLAPVNLDGGSGPVIIDQARVGNETPLFGTTAVTLKGGTVTVSGQGQSRAGIYSSLGDIAVNAVSGQLVVERSDIKTGFGGISLHSALGMVLDRSDVQAFSTVTINAEEKIEVSRTKISSLLGQVVLKAQGTVRLFDPGNPNDSSTIEAASGIKISSQTGGIEAKHVDCTTFAGDVLLDARGAIDASGSSLRISTGGAIRITSLADIDVSQAVLDSGLTGEIVMTAGTLEPLRSIYVNQAVFRDWDDKAQAYPRDLVNSIAVKIVGRPREGSITNGIITVP